MFRPIQTIRNPPFATQRRHELAVLWCLWHQRGPPMASPSPAPSVRPETLDETIRRLTAELHEACEQRAATTEVLEIINSSPGELTLVFDAMLEKAIRLCGGDRGVLWRIDGQRGHPAAARGLSAEFIALLR